MDPDRVDLSPIENGDISASYLSLPDVNHWMIGSAAAKSLAVPWRCWFVLKKKVDCPEGWFSPPKRERMSPWKGTVFQNKIVKFFSSRKKDQLFRELFGTPSPKLTARPWKWMVGRQTFPFEMAPFLGDMLGFGGVVQRWTLFCSISNVRSEFAKWTQTAKTIKSNERLGWNDNLGVTVD